ncbi:hypothetical protein MCBRY_000386 [Methylocystis bryophila]
MLRKLTLILAISAVSAAFATEASAAAHWRVGAGWVGRHFGDYGGPGWGLPAGGLRYGWGHYGVGYYGFGVPYYADRGHDYYGSAFPSDFIPGYPDDCGGGCPTYHARLTVAGSRW